MTTAVTPVICAMLPDPLAHQPRCQASPYGRCALRLENVTYSATSVLLLELTGGNIVWRRLVPPRTSVLQQQQQRGYNASRAGSNGFKLTLPASPSRMSSESARPVAGALSIPQQLWAARVGGGRGGNLMGGEAAA